MCKDMLDGGKLAELVNGLADTGGLLANSINDRQLWKIFSESPESLSLAHSFVKDLAAKYTDNLSQLQAVQAQSSQASLEETAGLKDSASRQRKVLSPTGSKINPDKNGITSVSYLPVSVKTQMPTQEKTSNTPAAPAPQAEPATPAGLKPGQIPAVSAPAAPSTGLYPQQPVFMVTSNARINEPFRAMIEAKSPTAAPVKVQQVLFSSELGLVFDVNSQELHGTPLVAGEHTLKLLYLFEDGKADTKPVDGECLLIVNHDPWSLWQDLPSDSSDEYWKADQDSFAMYGEDGLMMLAASKRGRSHAHVGSFRDDDFRLMNDEPGGWRVLTVADGAGSAKKSRKGSRIASRMATEQVLKAISIEADGDLNALIAEWHKDNAAGERPLRNKLYEIFGTAAMSAVNAIQEESQAKGYPYKDYSTTLLMAIHRKTPEGHFVGAYWVGDGGIGVYRKGQDLKLLGKADSGEFAGQTRFLDRSMMEAKEIWDRIQFALVPDFTAVIAMTDGITDPWFETDANLESRVKWDQLWNELEPLLKEEEPEKALQKWLDFRIAGNHDDRTIALLCPGGINMAEKITEEPAEDKTATVLPAVDNEVSP